MFHSTWIHVLSNTNVKVVKCIICSIKILPWSPRRTWGRPGLATNSIFSVSFLWKIKDLPGGQINDPSSGKHYSLPFHLAIPSSPLKGFLSGLLGLSTHLVRCVRSYRDTRTPSSQVWRARHGGPRTLDCAFVENSLSLHRSLIVKSQQNRIGLVTRPEVDWHELCHECLQVVDGLVALGQSVLVGGCHRHDLRLQFSVADLDKFPAQSKKKVLSNTK